MILRFAIKVLATVVFAGAGSSAWAQQYLISTLAGGAAPHTPAAAVRSGFIHPRKVATDAAGNLYFTAGRWVFKVDTTGLMTRLAGSATPGPDPGDGGPAIAAQLKAPGGVAADSAGNVYFADLNDFRIRKVTPDGTITTVAGNGTYGSSGDGGPATSAQLAAVPDIAADAAGNLYLADYNRIRKVGLNGAIATVAGNGVYGYSGDGGPATGAQLGQPEGVAVDAAGNLYIADSNNSRIRKVALNGTIATVAGNGTPGDSGDGGQARSAQIGSPYGVAMDSAGNLYFSDYDNHRIRKVATDGTITAAAGSGGAGYSGDGGLAANAKLNYPNGVAVDSAGDLFIADNNNNRIRRATAGYINTVAGNGTPGYPGDGGPAGAAPLGFPSGVAVDAAGDVFVVDAYAFQVFKVAPNGSITGVAGNGAKGYSGDNGPATSAQLSLPQSVAVDTGGNFYVSDQSACVIRKVTGLGTIFTVAGTGACGYSGDGGPAASAGLSSPTGVAVDSLGNLYIADASRIRKVTGTTIATVAGTGTSGYSGDGGPALSAQFASPQAVAVDAAGNLYIADTLNARIRKVTGGTITTVAGTGAAGYSGDGGPATAAKMNSPRGVAVDAAGNIYIADTYNRRVRKVGLDGSISTLAGNGDAAYSGDGGPAAGAGMDQPGNVAAAAGNVYIADSYNGAVRVLTPVASHALLNVTKTHSRRLAAGQAAAYSVLVTNAAGAGTASGSVTVTDMLPTDLDLGYMSGTGWNCVSFVCTRSDALSPGSSYPPLTVATTVTVIAAAGEQVVNYATVSGGSSTAATASDSDNVIPPPGVPVPVSPAYAASGVVLAPMLAWKAASGAASYQVYFGTSPTPPMVGTTTGATYAPGALASGTVYYWQVVAQNDAGSTPSAIALFTTGSPAVGLRFIPVTPCRVADTRGEPGLFGGPWITGGDTRPIPIPQSACGIPNTALAYSLNVTVVPRGRLSYLTLWPTGQSQAQVSTLNSWGGDVVANAAIVPAGTNGAVSVYVTDPTDVILDINGYFAASTSGSAFSFYPATPCRVADTRGAAGQFGGPSMYGGQSRDFPIPLSGCGIPAAAGGYSLNVTVVPAGYLGYLTAWPTGQAPPVASTLNSWKGKVVANGALVPGGTNESISVYVSDPTDLILDINGYFGQPGHAGALTFYPVAPCRVADTRNPAGPLGGPEIWGGRHARSPFRPAPATFPPPRRPIR